MFPDIEKRNSGNDTFRHRQRQPNSVNVQQQRHDNDKRAADKKATDSYLISPLITNLYYSVLAIGSNFPSSPALAEFLPANAAYLQNSSGYTNEELLFSS